jgi:hypothetical protein
MGRGTKYTAFARQNEPSGRLWPGVEAKFRTNKRVWPEVEPVCGRERSGIFM